MIKIIFAVINSSKIEELTILNVDLKIYICCFIEHVSHFYRQKLDKNLMKTIVSKLIDADQYHQQSLIAKINIYLCMNQCEFDQSTQSYQ